MNLEALSTKSDEGFNTTAVIEADNSRRVGVVEHGALTRPAYSPIH
jgi:hypothetical protein